MALDSKLHIFSPNYAAYIYIHHLLVQLHHQGALHFQHFHEFGTGIYTNEHGGARVICRFFNGLVAGFFGSMGEERPKTDRATFLQRLSGINVARKERRDKKLFDYQLLLLQPTTTCTK